MERAEGVVVAGRYRLVRKLGAGGMGSVWLAHDLSLDSQCALKLIDDEKASDPEVRVRFVREARAAAQVRGAHVVDVFDHGDWEGVPFMAMEYLEGEDLGTRLDRSGALDAIATYRIIAQVARALVRAHAAGIVHRDLKPENIFLVPGDEDEIAKVLDFGIAKHDAYSLRDKTTKTGSFLGTPYYVSPEQARGKSIDYRSDLWSLGVIAFYCLTGRAPFESEALGELMGLILYEEIPRPTERNPALPAALDAWWLRAAGRDPETRFQSAKEMADALGQALGVTQLLAVPSIPPRMPSPSTSDGSLSIPPPPALPAELRQRSPREGEPPLFGTRSDEQSKSSLPVTKTRRSLLPLPAELRRRHLFVFAAVGILLGAALTLLLVGSEQAAAVPASATQPVRAAVAPLSVPAEPLRVVAPSTPAAVSASAAPSASGRTADTSPKKKRAVVRQRPRGDVPDYGI